MNDFQPHTGFAPLSVIEGYWDALRAGREMPKRAEIDPRGIESALEYAFILERVAPGVARMRIAGSHLHRLMGMEARGMPVTAFFEQDCRLHVAGLLEEVFQTPGTADIIMYSAGSLGQPALEARMVLLPLKSDLGDVSRILGCLVSVGDMGTVPRRFDIRTSRLRPLDPAAAAPADATPVTRRNVPFKTFSHTTFLQTATLMRPSGTAKGGAQEKKRPAYLRLVKSDD